MLIVTLQGILYFLIAFLPNGNYIAPEIETAVNTLAGLLGQLNTIVPVDTIIIVLTLTLSINIAIWLFKIGEWILSKVWPTGQMKLPI